MDSHTFRESATDAIRYWEPRRLIYNAVLAVIVLVCFALRYPAAKYALSFDFAQFLFVLAVLANIAYCAAYPVDVFAQISGYGDLWKRHRWIMFVVGVLFAGILTRFFALGFFSNA